MRQNCSRAARCPSKCHFPSGAIQPGAGVNCTGTAPGKDTRPRAMADLVLPIPFAQAEAAHRDRQSCGMGSARISGGHLSRVGRHTRRCLDWARSGTGTGRQPSQEMRTYDGMYSIYRMAFGRRPQHGGCWGLALEVAPETCRGRYPSAEKSNRSFAAPSTPRIMNLQKIHAPNICLSLRKTDCLLPYILVIFEHSRIVAKVYQVILNCISLHLDKRSFGRDLFWGRSITAQATRRLRSPVRRARPEAMATVRGAAIRRPIVMPRKVPAMTSLTKCQSPQTRMRAPTPSRAKRRPRIRG